jgi:CRP/FNR family transcriptional regulator
LCLPRDLNDEETTLLEQIVERSRPYHGGEHLFRAGDSFRTIAAVRSGCFKSYLINEEGEEQVLDFHLPGEIVGLDAIHSGTHLSSCVALDTAAVCALSFGSLSDLARSIPALQTELFDIMSQRISELGITSGDYTADQRFASETVSRILSRMRDNDILEVRRKQIRIRDSDALHAMGQGNSA